MQATQPAVYGRKNSNILENMDDNMRTASSLTPVSTESASVWDDLDWVHGQLFMMGFDGTEINSQVKNLIETHHIGTILLTAKNLICN